MSSSLVECKSWPFEEARKILNRLQSQKKQSKPYVLFETGYGPSGLPHIGTFGEVLRTTMVRHAFSQLSDIPTRLFAFSDDMDGLRKVPDNIPQKEMVAQHLGKPLTKVPDPFGKFESFGHHNNAMLRDFLDSFGFQYEFQSSSDWYMSGRFDDALKKVFNHYEEIMALMLPSLREERRQTYSPFLPICPRTGVVLQVKMEELKADSFTIVYKDPENGQFVESPITGGACKLQWKVDWGMRWMELGVDYEMSGKDLIDSVKYSSQICRVLGGRSPENLTYELFLDDIGQKISKSKGNGLSIEEWLKYAPKESLSYYMFQAPKKAKRLYFDVIPKAVDEYITQVKNFKANFNADNPVYHIHKNQTPDLDLQGLSFGMLLNLASVCHAEDAVILRGFIDKYVTGLNDVSSTYLDQLIGYAIDYYHDFIAPHKTYRQPTDIEKAAILDLKSSLIEMDKNALTDQLQELVFNVGKRHHFENLRDWFACLYEVLLGQKEGPRMGSFIALYGIENTIQLIQEMVSE
ncbi:MAG: lysine--tRNA ligase [Candidatus Puniceispirillum sp.]|nr:lysine--tRNA ligase [Candidatus Pelagibacter sp.]MBA4283166.1 lysine--tRNA ligase [Candidatus Puniceispirillum sp.]